MCPARAAFSFFKFSQPLFVLFHKMMLQNRLKQKKQKNIDRLTFAVRTFNLINTSLTCQFTSNLAKCNNCFRGNQIGITQFSNMSRKAIINHQQYSYCWQTNWKFTNFITQHFQTNDNRSRWYLTKCFNP